MGASALVQIPAIPEGIPRSDIEDAAIIFGALAPSTRKSYECHIRRFSKAGYRLTGRDLARWIGDLREEGKAPSTIRTAAGAVRKFADALDRAFSPREIMLIQAALKTACRENRDKARGSVDGAGWEMADRSANLASLSGDWRGFRDAAIIRIASDGMLRVSEIAAIDIEHIREIGEGMGRLLLPFSKTDQEGKGAHVFLGPETMDAIRDWLKVSGIRDGALFLVERGPAKGRRIRPQSVHFMIQKRLKAAGAEGRMGGHSFRRGSAASLVKAGASLMEVQEAGRWLDPRCVKTYVAGQLGERGVLAKYRYGKD